MFDSKEQVNNQDSSPRRITPAISLPVCQEDDKESAPPASTPIIESKEKKAPSFKNETMTPSPEMINWEHLVKTDFAFYNVVYEEVYAALQTAHCILGQGGKEKDLWNKVYLAMRYMALSLEASDFRLNTLQVYGYFWQNKEMRLIEDSYAKLSKKDIASIKKIKYLRNTGRWLPIETLCEILTLPSRAIENLNLSQNNIGDAGLELLAKILPTTDISHLNLSHNSISDAGFIKLTEVLPQTDITMLNLKANSITGIGLKALVQVLRQTKITQLYLGENALGVASLEMLIKILPQTSITHLELGFCHIDESLAQRLAEILPDTKIIYLDIHENNLRDKGISGLAHVLPKSKIQFLNLAKNYIGDAGIQELAKHLPQTKILALNLKNNIWGESGAKKLTMSLPQTSIAHLNLSGNDLSRSLTPVLAQALSLTPIIHLNLEACKIGGPGLIELINLLPKTVIHDLNLSNTSLSSSTLKTLIKILPSTVIRTLKLAMNKIRGDIALEIARVLPRTQVITLDIKYNLINGLDLIEFTSALATTQIINLDISGNNQETLESTHLIRLMRAFMQSSIRTLCLSHNRLGNAGISYLAKFLPQTFIVTLDIRENDINDAGLRELAKSLPLSHVVNLMISDSISEAAWKELESVFPSARINHHGAYLSCLKHTEMQKATLGTSPQSALAEIKATKSKMELPIEVFFGQPVSLSQSTSSTETNTTPPICSEAGYDLMLVKIPENQINIQEVDAIAEQRNLATFHDAPLVRDNDQVQASVTSSTKVETQLLDDGIVMFRASSSPAVSIGVKDMNFPSAPQKKTAVLIRSGQEVFIYGFSQYGVWEITKLDSSIGNGIHFPEPNQLPLRLDRTHIPETVIQEINLKGAHIPPLSDSKVSLQKVSTLFSPSRNRPPRRVEIKRRNSEPFSTMNLLGSAPSQIRPQEIPSQSQETSLKIQAASGTEAALASVPPSTSSSTGKLRPVFLANSTLSSAQASPVSNPPSSLKRDVMVDPTYHQTLRQEEMQQGFFEGHVAQRRNSAPCLESNTGSPERLIPQPPLPDPSKAICRKQKDTTGSSESISAGVSPLQRRRALLPSVPLRNISLRPKSNSLPLNLRHLARANQVSRNRNNERSYSLAETDLPVSSEIPLNPISLPSASASIPQLQGSTSASLKEGPTPPTQEIVVVFSMRNSESPRFTQLLSSQERLVQISSTNMFNPSSSHSSTQSSASFSSSQLLSAPSTTAMTMSESTDVIKPLAFGPSQS